MDVAINQIQVKQAVRYLGVAIDKKLTYWKHTKKTADIAAIVTTTLSRFMAIIVGPKSSKPRILMTVTQSTILCTILYG